MSCFGFPRSLSIGLLRPVWSFIPAIQRVQDEGCVYRAVHGVCGTVVALGGTEQCGEYVEYTDRLFASDNARDATKATSSLQ